MESNSRYSSRMVQDINNTSMVTERGSSYQSKSNSSRIINTSNLILTDSNYLKQSNSINSIISSTTIKREQRREGKSNPQIIQDIQTKKYRHTVGQSIVLIDSTSKKKSVFKEEEQDLTKLTLKVQFTEKRTLLNSIALNSRKYQLQNKKESLLHPKLKGMFLEVIKQGNGVRRSSSDISTGTFVRSTISSDISYE